MNPISTIASFGISAGYCCSDCQVVMNVPWCPYCLTRNVGSLARWLNRKGEIEKQMEQLTEGTK